MKLKGPLILAAAIVAGDILTEKFVIKDGPDDTGFVQRTDGFGMDEIVKVAVQVVLAVLFMKWFAGKKGV